MKSWHFHLIATLLAFHLAPMVGAVPTEEVIVTTLYGKVKGISYPSQFARFPERWINVFRGVPYAKRLSQYKDEWREKYRFHNPDEDPYWHEANWDATYHRPACPQMPWMIRETVRDFSEVSEDCLYLDIYTPNIKSERPTTNPSLFPVLVYIHGGGFIMGNSRQWPGVFLAERNIVVVIVNYRLNALGFFSTGDRYAPGNYGMMDQVKALKFVRKTIRSFRGNPDMITLMGQDAGAASVGMHMISPMSVDLFHRAIMLSGSEMSEWAVMTKDDVKHYSKKLCERLGCPTADSQQMIDCLRYSRKFDEIVNASAMIPMKPGRIGNPWGPTVDGPVVGVNFAFLPEHPGKSTSQGRRMRIPLLAGVVGDEGAYYIPNLPNLIDGVELAQFQNIIREFIRYRDVEQPNTLQDALEFQYTYWPQPTNISSIRKMLMEMMGDYMFGSALSETLRSHARFAPTYFYVFEYSSWKNYVPHWRGVSHGQDLDYIFGLPFVNETYLDFLNWYPRQHYEYPERNISEYMINMITNFTAQGEPTPRSFEINNFRNVSWYHYNLENHTYLSIKNNSQNKEGYRIKEAKFWNNFYPKVAGYSPYYRQESVAIEPDKLDKFEIATWSLTAACGVLLIIVIFLTIVLIRRSRPKKYPKYKSSSSLNREISI